MKLDQLASELTSMRVGGRLGPTFFVSSSNELPDVLNRLPSLESSSLQILGSGSNIVFSDEGFPGYVVILQGGKTFRDTRTIESASFIVDAGVLWDDFVTLAIREGCCGVEMMSGIPGTVGAAPIQNIAAYGQQVGDVIDWVEAIDRETNKVIRLTGTECEFAFRSSVFKEALRDRLIVSRVRFVLPDATIAPPKPSNYVDIERYFETGEKSSTDVIERRQAVLIARARKSMLLNSVDPMSRSVGSFFINPCVRSGFSQELATTYGTTRLRVNYLEGPLGCPPDHSRTPASHLLRYSGFNPGDKWGRVQLSDKHLLSVVACEGSTASDIWLVGEHLRNTVYIRTGVLLNHEASFVGNFPTYTIASFKSNFPFSRGKSPEPDWLLEYRSSER